MRQVACTVGLGMHPCNICGNEPQIEYERGEYVIFCPNHDNDELLPDDELSIRTFPWEDIFDAVSEWQINKGPWRGFTPTFRREQLELW